MYSQLCYKVYSKFFKSFTLVLILMQWDVIRCKICKLMILRLIFCNIVPTPGIESVLMDITWLTKSICIRQIIQLLLQRKTRFYSNSDAIWNSSDAACTVVWYSICAGKSNHLVGHKSACTRWKKSAGDSESPSFFLPPCCNKLSIIWADKINCMYLLEIKKQYCGTKVRFNWPTVSRSKWYIFFDVLRSDKTMVRLWKQFFCIVNRQVIQLLIVSCKLHSSNMMNYVLVPLISIIVELQLLWQHHKEVSIQVVYLNFWMLIYFRKESSVIHHCSPH